MKNTDFLVIGSGIAGLSFALKVAERGKVVVISKGKSDETATSYAQGGIAAVMYSPDTYEKHINDTLIAGDRLNDKRIVEMAIRESTSRINELIEWGTQFDQKDGKYDLGKEGGHSENRILHNKDKTGREIQQVLLQKVRDHKNIEILEDYFTVDLITQHHLGVEVTRRSKDITCYGAYVMTPDEKKIETLRAKVTMVATGGLGNLYAATTNPKVATGDGLAMVYRAKGMIENMEFIQFHPTSLYNPGEVPSFLITEAIRGAGAILKTIEGHEFMEAYDPRGCLAPRDIVARAIDAEMKKSGSEHVWLDCTAIDKNKLRDSFPTIYDKCLILGLDITKDWIPVVPAAHYSCGGIKVDENGQTTIANLYASGECSSTGLHGANRLASNSLLEAVVFSHRAAEHSKKVVDSIGFQEGIPEWDISGAIYNEEMVLITQSLKELQAIMSSYVGIVRSGLRLQRALDRLEILYRETEDLYEKSILSIRLCELRNLINVAYLVIKMAMNRKESRGLHFMVEN